MTQEVISVEVPLESIIKSVTRLSMRDKRRLWRQLEAELAEADEARYEEDPETVAAIRDAKAEYVAGDYLSIEEYLAGRDANPS